MLKLPFLFRGFKSLPPSCRVKKINLGVLYPDISHKILYPSLQFLFIVMFFQSTVHLCTHTDDIHFEKFGNNLVSFIFIRWIFTYLTFLPFQSLPRGVHNIWKSTVFNLSQGPLLGICRCRMDINYSDAYIGDSIVTIVQILNTEYNQ